MDLVVRAKTAEKKRKKHFELSRRVDRTIYCFSFCSYFLRFVIYWPSDFFLSDFYCFTWNGAVILFANSASRAYWEYFQDWKWETCIAKKSVCYVTNGINEKEHYSKQRLLSVLPKGTFRTQHYTVAMESMTPLWHTTPCMLSHTHTVYYKNKREHKHSTHSSLRNPWAIDGNWPAPRPNWPTPPTGAVPNSVWLGDRWPTQSRYLPSNRNSWHAQRPYLHK